MPHIWLQYMRYPANTSLWPGDAILSHRTWSALVQINKGLLPDGTKAWPEPTLTHHKWSLVTLGKFDTHTWYEFENI